MAVLGHGARGGGHGPRDAGITYDAVEQVPVGYCFQSSTAGQRAAYELGLTGVPVYNVNNNCATGSSALMLARQFVEGGLRLRPRTGLREDEAGGAGGRRLLRHPVARHYGVMAARHGFEMSPPTAQIFGDAAREHMERYGTTEEHSPRSAPRTTGTRRTTRTPSSRTCTGSTRSSRHVRAPPADQAPVLAHLGRRRRGRRVPERFVERTVWRTGRSRSSRRP